MKRTILFADGDGDLCDLYQMYVADRGYHVEIASEGLDCLEKLRRARPDVLVLDLG
jgi:DNA-binding response OmpR family regulator